MPKAIFNLALNAFIASVRQTGTAEGVLVAGSFVNGQPGPFSDLDVYLLISTASEMEHGWRTQDQSGVEIELTAYTAEEFLSRMEHDNAVRNLTYPLSTGRIVFDDHGRLAQIVQRAKEKVAELSEAVAPSEETITSVHRALLFGYRKVGNAFAANDPATFAFEISHNLSLIPILAATLRGHRFCVKPLAVIEAMPQLWTPFVECIEGGSLASRWRRYNLLMGILLKEFDLGALPAPLWPLDAEK